MNSFDIHFYVHMDKTDSKPNVAMDHIVHMLDKLTKEVSTMADELAKLQAAVASNTTVTQSAITLIQGIKTALDAAIASNDPAALQALSDSLGNDDTALAAAITANTPAATAASARR